MMATSCWFKSSLAHHIKERRIMSMFAEIVSDASFEEKVLKSDRLVLVDFFAPWCGPCRALSPVIDEIAQEADGRYDVFKINVDESPRTAAEYGIRSIPMLIGFKGGKASFSLNGYVEKAKIKAEIEKML